MTDFDALQRAVFRCSSDDIERTPPLLETAPSVFLENTDQRVAQEILRRHETPLNRGQQAANEVGRQNSGWYNDFPIAKKLRPCIQ